MKESGSLVFSCVHRWAVAKVSTLASNSPAQPPLPKSPFSYSVASTTQRWTSTVSFSRRWPCFFLLSPLSHSLLHHQRRRKAKQTLAMMITEHFCTQEF
ncbi:unnamed protein product [Coffea canephora]|uniref:Uncharacterized protein n=1 Tax=Coffea canephora TaxID=49390 RepID=A0A068UNI1_COFCA|nr:unnamed protein product [Coffea canephora]